MSVGFLHGFEGSVSCFEEAFEVEAWGLGFSGFHFYAFKMIDASSRAADREDLEVLVFPVENHGTLDRNSIKQDRWGFSA
jgi:hypothetical protein